LLALTLLRLAEILPLDWGRGLCTGLARLAYRVRPSDRRLALENLARAFPQASVADRQFILRSAVDHLGINLFHTLAASRMLERPGAVIEETRPGADNISIGKQLAGLAARDRGVFVLTGHIGCWELAGGWLAQTIAARSLGKLGVVTGTIHNPPVDRLIQRRRRDLGVEVLPREAGAGPLIRYLKSGGVVAVLQDQRISVRNMDVPFFGTEAPTAVGLASLALKYSIPILPSHGSSRSCLDTVFKTPNRPIST
jgi:lauroyl/myristoyl acyltransferase